MASSSCQSLGMHQSSNTTLRVPEDFRKNVGGFQSRGSLTKLLREAKLVTVCEEAHCPNIGECFASGTATFMIMGDTCTRSCNFCSVKTGRPLPLAADEPVRLAEAARTLGLKHVVITSVDRDELKDCGAGHWAKCIEEVIRALPNARVEILTPDFKGRRDAIDRVLKAGPHVFNHNIETVPRLYHALRPQSYFDTSLGLLKYVADSGHPTVKSGLMLGLGEDDDEVIETMHLLRDAGVHVVTLGQYLRPTMKHWGVDRYVHDSSYDRFVEAGKELGFSHVFAGPFVRSSYHAAESDAQHRMNVSERKAYTIRGTKTSLPVL